jgi:hypothetical protein
MKVRCGNQGHGERLIMITGQRKIERKEDKMKGL